jgi:hypothetical protein
MKIRRTFERTIKNNNVEDQYDDLLNLFRDYLEGEGESEG